MESVEGSGVRQKVVLSMSGHSHHMHCAQPWTATTTTFTSRCFEPSCSVPDDPIDVRRPWQIRRHFALD